MTSQVVFDASAWWEVLHETDAGKRLARRFLDAPGTLMVTVDFTLAELAAKLAKMGEQLQIPGMLHAVELASEIASITPEVAASAGSLRLELRKVQSDAGLADAVGLATARLRSAVLVSNDSCFEGCGDVRWISAR